MHGRQVSLFLTKSDLADFELSLLAARPETVILKHHSLSSRPELLTTFSALEYGKEVLRVLLARAQDLETIHYKPIRGRDEFYCSPLENLIVEFDRPFVTSEFIRAGRLYFVPSDIDEFGHKVMRSAEFIGWADTLIRIARRRLSKVADLGYAGPDALKMQALGVALKYA